MRPEIVIEVVRIIPSILWFIFVCVLIIRLYDPIKAELLPRLGEVRAFGFEARFVREELQKAARKRGTEISNVAQSAVERRLRHNASLMQGAKILWVDDNPSSVTYESRILRSVDVRIDTMITTKEALSMLSENDYDMVISDIARGDAADEGIRFLSLMRERNLLRPTIFYVGQVDWDAGTPPYAFGITNRVDELLHYIMDVVERKRI